MPQNQDPELDTAELIGLVEGTVDELKQYVRDRDFSDEELEQVLRAEVASKDRKTAKNFLRRRIDSEEVLDAGSGAAPAADTVPEGDSELDREALLKMLGGTVEDVKEYVKENDPDDQELQNLLHAEKMVKDRKTVVRFLKSYSKKRELEEDFHKAENDLQSLKQDLKTIEEDVLEEDIELELDEVPEPEELNDETEEEQDTEEEDVESEEAAGEDVEPEAGEEEDQDEAPGEEEAEGSGNEEEEVEDESGEETGTEEPGDEEEIDEMERKKQLLEDMDMELSEEELEQISLEELEKLKKEKKKREKLIERLSQKFDREQLEQLTTRDLGKLADELDGSLESKHELEQQRKAEKQKDEEELKKEAQEDLEMMMGAVRSSDEDDEDSEPGAMDQLRELPDKFKGIFERGQEEEEEEATGFDDEKVLETLEEYREAGGREAAIKTAQVMKGYLEYALGIDRELTYAELADELESRELESQNIQVLIEFYRSMKISVYTGDVKTGNIDEVLNAAETSVKELG